MPWLIVTSLPGGIAITKKIMAFYTTRMQIEESFRDIKNARWGFSLDEAKASTAARYENLLLIGVLATFSVWLIGKIAEIKSVHRQYQANTIKTRNVLSTFYLGCRVLEKQVVHICLADYHAALKALVHQSQEQSYA